ncbi:MAG: hypothetical protein WBQ19_05880 [Terriglobales bacterium]
MTKLKMPSIQFNLAILTNRDEDAKAWVGYIPALRLYAQARTEERLERALRQTALSFIGLCWHRKILDEVMRERGMRKSSTAVTAEAKKAGGQYIVVGGEVERDVYGEVPISLLAGKKAMIECPH